METRLIFSTEEFASIDAVSEEEAIALAADLLASGNTALGGAPQGDPEKRRNLLEFLKELANALSKMTADIPPRLVKPGPTATFIDLIAGAYAPQLGLSTPLLLTTFAIVAARYGLPGFIEKFRN